MIETLIASIIAVIVVGGIFTWLHKSQGEYAPAIGFTVSLAGAVLVIVLFLVYVLGAMYTNSWTLS